jgi:hypothetical protein
MPDYPIPPVIGVTRFKSDLVVKRQGGTPQQGGGSRKEIKEFSEHSRKRLAFVASNTAVVFKTMITLTYPKQYPNDGSRVKRDLQTFLKAWRRYTRGCEILWFLEFQERGAPHVHILCDYVLPGKMDDRKNVYKWVGYKWFKVCGELDPAHLYAGTRTEKLRSPEGGAHYAVKYALKMRQKVVPEAYRNVGRFWGHTKAVTPQPLAHYRCTEDDLRGLLDTWEHKPREDRPIYHTLYNCSDRLLAYLDGTLDQETKEEYTVPQGQRPRAPSKTQGKQGE